MKRAAVLPFLAWALPLAAQTPFHVDGTAFGGSRVFAYGLNPLGSPARVDLPLQGLHLAYVDGGQEAPDFQKVLDRLRTTPDLGPALRDLAGAPWAARTRAFALSQRTERDLVSLSREETTSLVARPDLDAGRLSRPLNQTLVDQRRTVVDRLVLATASKAQNYTFGAQFRIEQWRQGLRTLDLAATSTQDPWTTAGTSQRTLSANVDLGIEMEVVPGLRAGATVDRLFAKRYWDIQEKPQFRVGVQMDLGTLATLSGEADLKSAVRMPYALPQRTTAASLTVKANSSFTLVLGAERRKLGEAAATRGGVTVWFHPSASRAGSPPLLIGAGMQVGADRPMRGLSAWGNL